MVGTVCLVMFIVLFLVFGSVTLPLKAMLMNAISISASFGAIVWVFQDGRFSDILRYTPLGISDSTAPLLMFSIVFGLSMDYEVLILARIQEEYKKTGDNDLAVARGLARTGRLITSAALLLVVVIGAFGTSHIIFMKSLGLGMALAVLLDATIIRALLVPAAMKLMGHWNWWAPAPLKKLADWIGLGEGH
jgi:RND superfamily putative drug exporter